MLSAEHRSASGTAPVALELASAESGPHLRLASVLRASELAARDALPGQNLASLGQSSEPCTAESIRSNLQVRNQRLIEALRQLVEQRKIVRLSQGYVLASSTPTLMLESSSPRVAPR